MSDRWRPFLLLLAAMAAILSAGAGEAAPVAEVETDHALTRIEPEREGLVPGAVNWFVMDQVLQQGWHVYWRNPGDSGLPLETVWEAPDGFAGGDPAYPVPERIPVGPFVNFGHHGAPVFLLPLTVPAGLDDGATVNLRLRATWLICEEICVPESGDFELSMTVDAGAPPGPAAARANAARAAGPKPFAGTAVYQPSADGLTLAVAPWSGAVDDAFFFPEQEGLTEPSGKQVVRRKDGALTIRLPAGLAYAPGDLDRVKGVLTVNGEAFEVDAGRDPAQGGATTTPVSPSPDLSTAPNLPLLLLAAFFGGALLNIMPCVFPILFVKAASFMHAAHDQRGVIRRHGVLYTAGVLATFLALGGLLIALRAGGAELGWGFHLQSPVVVAISAYVLFLVGLNLAGVFSVGGGLQNVGSGLAARTGDAGAFFTGALAVFVAAPCIGPLLSAPVGAAALLPPLAGFTIFAVMGFGLAAPYAALSFAPGLASRLPRPGPWMSVFKQALSFPVFAAAAFFFWVLAQQVAAPSLAAAFAGLVLLAFAAWIFEQGKGEGRFATLARGLAAIAILAAVLPALRLSPAQATTAGSIAAADRLAYDADAIAARQADGQGVFVDFTAAWCVTCQFNKTTIFSRASFKTLLAENNVALMTADWTRRDAEITAALEAFGANGVPFYVYYPAHSEAPVVIPVPISEASIRRAILQSKETSSS